MSEPVLVFPQGKDLKALPFVRVSTKTGGNNGRRNIYRGVYEHALVVPQGDVSPALPFEWLSTETSVNNGRRNTYQGISEQALVIPHGEGFRAVPYRLLSTRTGGSTSSFLGSLIPFLLLALIIPRPGPVPSSTSLLPASPVVNTCPVCLIPALFTPVPTCPAQCIPTPACPSGFIKLSNNGVEIPDKCYYFTTTGDHFFKNLMDCTVKGGTLANPMTEDEGLALKTYLQNNYVDVEFFLGYTDVENGDVLLALSGGPLDIPGLGDIAIAYTKDVVECGTIRVDTKGSVILDTRICSKMFNGVCEVNLSNQNCICDF